MAIEIVEKGASTPIPIPESTERTRKDLRADLERVFQGLPFFSRVVDPGGERPLYVEFEPVVIQFPGENLDDLHGNVNYVAADQVRRLLRKDVAGVRLVTTTSPVGSEP